MKNAPKDFCTLLKGPRKSGGTVICSLQISTLKASDRVFKKKWIKGNENAGV